MNSKTYRYSPNSSAQIQRYGIFERKVYNKETGRYILQYPRIWNDDSKAMRGKDYREYDIVSPIDKNYDLYAIWPEVNVYIIYNLFSTTKKYETVIGKEYVLENMSADVPGFKGWLDKNMEFHLPDTVITPVANTQLFLSTCQELSVSYDLNNGSIQNGKYGIQTSLYSKWMNADYSIEDIDATILVDADDPIPPEEKMHFGYWVIDGANYYKGDRVNFKRNCVAKAQWLYEPTYSFFEGIEFNGDDHGEEYGEINTIGQSESSVRVSRRYEALPAEGYKFDYFKIQLFDGYEMQPEETYDGSPTKEVSITKYDPVADDLVTQLNVYVTTTAYFSEDLDSWFRIKYQDDHIRLVKKPNSSSSVVTNAMLQTAGVTEIARIQFPTNDVEHVENGIFSGCTNLVELQIATKLREFPQNMCKNDTKLITISYTAFPQNLKTIGASAFEGCSQLTSIGQPLVDNITSFGNRAFYGTQMSTFSFSSSTSSIGNSIFGNVTTLGGFTLKTSTLGVLGTNALDGSSVTKITLTNISSRDILGR